MRGIMSFNIDKLETKYLTENQQEEWSQSEKERLISLKMSKEWEDRNDNDDK